MENWADYYASALMVPLVFRIDHLRNHPALSLISPSWPCCALRAGNNGQRNFHRFTYTKRKTKDAMNPAYDQGRRDN
jgi:hypothetical protein